MDDIIQLQLNDGIYECKYYILYVILWGNFEKALHLGITFSRCLMIVQKLVKCTDTITVLGLYLFLFNFFMLSMMQTFVPYCEISN